MKSLKLSKRTWKIGAQIGDRSGFGRVFEAIASDGFIGVVKMVPKGPGAERELLFEDLVGAPNVVPIIESGEWEDFWVLAMPRADRSLRAHLQEIARPLSPTEALPVLVDVAQALAGFEGRVVHRDVKPENILLLEGRWCLADFGIARYAEASTDPATRKLAMSPPYAAPERWRLERATTATDVYALGIVAWETLIGRLPFPGPSWDDFREQHLHTDSPPMQGVPASLASILSECLYKAPAARPTPRNLVARLERSANTPDPAAGRLQAANRAIIAQRAKDEVEASRASSVAARHEDLYAVAVRSLATISSLMRAAILEHAPAAMPDSASSADDWALRLGSASLGMDPAKRVKLNSFGRFKPPFDVVAFAAIGVTIPPGSSEYCGRCHSLWYGDLQEKGIYRWFEIGFMMSPLLGSRFRYVPAAMDPNEDAGKAFSNALAEICLARPVVAIDQGEEQEFVTRWIEWFGQAAMGELESPRSLPEGEPRGSCR